MYCGKQSAAFRRPFTFRFCNFTDALYTLLSFFFIDFLFILLTNWNVVL